MLHSEGLQGKALGVKEKEFHSPGGGGRNFQAGFGSLRGADDSQALHRAEQELPLDAPGGKLSWKIPRGRAGISFPISSSSPFLAGLSGTQAGKRKVLFGFLGGMDGKGRGISVCLTAVPTLELIFHESLLC